MPRIAVKGRGKRYPLNMRTTKEVREILERAAKESGRSLVQEVERRLESSFQLDALFHLMGAGGQELSRPIMLYLAMLAMKGVNWRNVIDEVREGIALIIEAVAGNGLPKSTAKRFLISAKSKHGSPGGDALTLAYSFLAGAGLAPDPSSLDLQVKK